MLSIFSIEFRPNFHTTINRRPEVKIPVTVTCVSSRRRSYVRLGEKWLPRRVAFHTSAKKFLVSL
jgi:hypothetical protein